MPELPDIEAYLTALTARVLSQPLQHIRLASPFLLRTAQPPLSEAEGHTVRDLRRIGKRIAIGMDNNIWLVLHLMIAGRLHWRPPQVKLAGRNALAAFDFPNGSLVLTEAGAKRRASLHVLSGEEDLHSIDPGGIDVFASDLNAFRAALTAENRTLKRALTDPRLLSGIGNAYSDEILHAAQLSPITLTHKLKPEEWERLYSATQQTLQLWIDRLQTEAKASFPEKSHRLPRRHGRPRPLRPALPPLRRKGPTHPLRRQRNQLLPPLPNQQQTPGRPRPLPPPRLRLAPHPRRTGIPKAPLDQAPRPKCKRRAQSLCGNFPISSGHGFTGCGESLFL